MSEALLSVRGVSHRFGETPVLRDITLDVAAGSYAVLLGPSGSGKTTLLSILGGFLMPSEGRVLIGGNDCTASDPAERPTATVFQDYALFPHMSVGGNVGFGLMIRGMAKAERLVEVLKALRLVGLEGSIDSRPHRLSGGQRQRVALARALAVKPAVLLLDEPLGALDLKLRRQMQGELKAIQKEVGTAFLHVTHDQEEAMALADLCVVLNRGRIEDLGPPEQVYLRPRSRFSATFMGESTILEGEIKDGAILTPLGRLALHEKHADGAAAACIRPENVHFAMDIGGEPVRLGRAAVSDVVFQGSFKRVRARSERDPAVTLIARAAPGDNVEVNSRVELFCRPQDIVVLRS